ncbi:hypothetical protein N9L68_08175 [bacterium]|nr:hypothetical protein [bacterium]
MPSCSRLCPQANTRLQELSSFEGGVNLVNWLPEPPETHDVWNNGINTAGGSMRALRVLMPVGMAIDILEHADMSVFVEKAGAVECRWDQLRVRLRGKGGRCGVPLGPVAEPRLPGVCLKERPEQFTAAGVNRMKVHCKTVELPLNYHRVMAAVSSARRRRRNWTGRNGWRSAE